MKDFIMTPTRDKIHDISPEIIKTLRMIFWDNLYATKAIQRTLKLNPEWDDEKRALFADILNGLIRMWRLLWYIIDRKPSPEEKNLQKLITIYLFAKKSDLYVLEKKRGLDTQHIEQRIKTIQTIRVLRESIPDWFDYQGEKELGTRWDAVIASLNKNSDQIIRVNTLKTTVNELIAMLLKDNVAVKKINCYPDALAVIEKTNLFKLTSFKAGFFEVQDAASQMVSRFLDPKPGMRVIDACAGEGSKTLHLAALMQNKGKIIALDTQEWRLKELRKRAIKAGVDNIETRLINSSKMYKRISGTADRLLLDVPCSGFGTLRRNPDIKWKLTPPDFDRLKVLQQSLLEKYCIILKPSGNLVYSVCSIFFSEGEDQIQRFLKNHSSFRLLNEKRFWPDIDQTDGFYMALIQRTS